MCPIFRHAAKAGATLGSLVSTVRTGSHTDFDFAGLGQNNGQRLPVHSWQFEGIWEKEYNQRDSQESKVGVVE